MGRIHTKNNDQDAFKLHGCFESVIALVLFVGVCPAILVVAIVGHGEWCTTKSLFALSNRYPGSRQIYMAYDYFIPYRYATTLVVFHTPDSITEVRTFYNNAYPNHDFGQYGSQETWNRTHLNPPWESDDSKEVLVDLVPAQEGFSEMDEFSTIGIDQPLIHQDGTYIRYIVDCEWVK